VEDEAIIVDGDGGGGVEAAGRGEEGGFAGAIFLTSLMGTRDAKLREEAHWAHVNYWEDHLSHGHPRNKIVLHYQPPKRSTLRPIVVVHKSYG